MRKWILPLTAAAGVAALSVGTLNAQQGAAPAIPGTMDTSRVEAGTYKTDKNHSIIGWRLNHLGFNDYFGIFGDVDGTLTLDPANPAASKLDVTVPINPTLASAGLRDHFLRAGRDGGKPDFWGPNPAAARFVSTSVTPGPNNTATIVGDLTMNGQTKPVTINAQFAGAGNSMQGKKTVGFEGTAKVKRSDWGLGLAAPMVSDETDLEISVAFEKQ